MGARPEGVDKAPGARSAATRGGRASGEKAQQLALAPAGSRRLRDNQRMTTALLAVGYILAVPFTVWVPGFKRLWRRREPLVFAAAQLGAVLLVVAYARKHQLGGVLVNGGWAVGLTVAYVLEGLKRARLAAPAQ